MSELGRFCPHSATAIRGGCHRCAIERAASEDDHRLTSIFDDAIEALVQMEKWQEEGR